MKLKVSTTNFYVRNPHPGDDAKFLVSTGIDIGGVQEGHSGNAQAIKHALPHNFDVYWREVKNASHDKELAFTDVPVIFSKKLKIHRTWARQISARSQTKNIGMPRAATGVRFEKDGFDVTFINTHTNAAVQNRVTKVAFPSKVRRVAEYIAGMIVLDRMLKNARKRGDLVILVGDLNWRQGAKGVWRYSPEALFKKHKMNFKANGLDYIAYSHEFTPSNYETIPTTKTGSDHPWDTLELEVK